MADRWMDERDRDRRDRDWRDRDWRDRDWRRSEAHGRGGEERGRAGETPRWGEDRTWAGEADDDRGRYERSAGNRADYEGGEDYGGRAELTSGGGYGGESYGRGSGRPQGYRTGPNRDRYGERVRVMDYTGRHDADEAGRADYGDERGASYGRGREARAWGGGEDRSYDRYGAEMRRRASGSYGDRGDFDERRAREDEARRERGRAEGSGDFLQRTGERISSWFRGRPEDESGRERRYREDWGREARAIPEPGHRGVGPKGYRRSDERISDEVHERLTEDSWLDASNIEVQVRDGEVTLSGHVENRAAKHRAEALVEDLAGVRHVQNNLRVDAGGLTGGGHGYGSSALEEQMRREALARDAGSQGAGGRSRGAGAEAERSTGGATQASVDPKTGEKH